MHRHYNDAEVQFSEFMSSLVAGDPTILLSEVRLGHLALLLANGVVARTPEIESQSRLNNY